MRTPFLKIFDLDLLWLNSAVSGHLGCPLLLGWPEVVQALQIPEQMDSAPCVQCAGQVPVAGVSVADDHALVAGQHPPPASIASADRSPVCMQAR